ncbi:MAG: PAS domain-containing sensor histidine kinase [Muribaculaceae bacterium]|nr:PAS domain-containing sensor histidine kinase [Muribaculaceae bacterium]
MSPESIIKIMLAAARSLCILLLCLCPVWSEAEESKSLMIINSFDYKEPWVDDLTQAVIRQTAKHPDVKCNIVDIDTETATDSTAFRILTDEFIAGVGDHKPSYVVMIGNLAFNMRRAIQKAWGDVPILLVTKLGGIAPLGDYSGAIDRLRTLGEFRLDKKGVHNYNFTAIVIPSFYDETLEMMNGLIPDMNELVFISDSLFYNRIAATTMSAYIERNMPGITFRWLCSSRENADAVRPYFENKNPRTGLLVSTMTHNNETAYGTVYSSTDDIRLISNSRNPVFAVSRTGLKYGAIGGVYPVVSEVRKKAVEILDKMLAGEDMRDIPICRITRNEAMVMYPALERYSLDADLCPPDTIFVDRPTSFIERHSLSTMLMVSALLLAIVIIISQIRYRRNNSRILRRNQTFIRNLPMPYAATHVCFDDKGGILGFEYRMKNDAYQRIVDSNRIEGSVSKLFPSDFICPKVEQLLGTREPVKFTYHFKATDTYYTFILRLAENSIFDRSPDSKLIDVFALDFTDLHRSELQLRMLASRLDVTLEAAGRNPFTFEVSEGQVVYDSYIRNADEKVRRNVRLDFDSRMDLVHPDDRHLFTELIYDRRAKDDCKFGFEYRIKNDGSEDDYTWMEISGLIEKFDKYGRPARLIGSLRVITARKQREQKMAEALRRASESDAMKSTFLANISHEIRTPLNAIVGFSNVLAQTDDKAERMKFCDIINRNNTQLLALIDDVVDLAQIEGNMVELSYADTDINRLMEEVRDKYQEMTEPGVTLELTIPARQCVANVDSMRLKQVLGHLLSNSCKFTHNGFISMGYDILDEGTLYFSVKDSGRGIPADEIGKVFDRFFKGDPFVPGSGLGLPLCKKIIEKMGGRIGVMSDGEGSGATFWFAIPLAGASDFNK